MTSARSHGRNPTRILALAAAASIHAAALPAQTREDSLAVLHEVERALQVPLAKPGAEGHFLIVGVAAPLSGLAAMVAETFGRLCVEGSRLTPELGIASIELTRFVIGGDTALVQVRTTDGSSTSGTLDLWRLRRDPAGGWQGSVASGTAWEGEAARGPPRSVRFCRGREPG